MVAEPPCAGHGAGACAGVAVHLVENSVKVRSSHASVPRVRSVAVERACATIGAIAAQPTSRAGGASEGARSGRRAVENRLLYLRRS